MKSVVLCKSEEYKLFINSWKTSLKAVLLHNDNNLRSNPIVHVVHMKETYDTTTEMYKLW